MTTKHNALTPVGVANLLVRGISANFAPDHQKVERERMVEYLQDLAMSRSQEAEFPDTTTTSAARAKQDASWLGQIAGALEAA
jgi:hypothetical protein